MNSSSSSTERLHGRPGLKSGENLYVLRPEYKPSTLLFSNDMTLACTNECYKDRSDMGAKITLPNVTTWLFFTLLRQIFFQLIDDKKALGEKCETLLKEMKTMDKKYSDRLKGTEDK